jgi:thiosulfate dehydrogenase
MALCFAAAATPIGGSAALAADAVRGGQMYDKWWAVNGAAEPQGEHPLYPTDVNSLRGPDTFRCKECHGWDYKGADGRYGSGSHFTGIRGVLGSAKTPPEMTDILKNPPAMTPNGHDLANYGLSDEDAEDLVAFLTTLLIDTDDFVNDDKTLKGDPAQGSIWYHNLTQGACANCHGLDGTLINFGDEEEPEWVGTIAVDNPWEFLHKVRAGHPGSIMPSWTRLGGSDQGAADIGRWIQVGDFPVAPPVVPPAVGEFTVQSGSAKLGNDGWAVKVNASYSGFEDSSSVQITVDGVDYFAGQTPKAGSNGKLTLGSGSRKAVFQLTKGRLKLAMRNLPAADLDPSDGVAVTIRFGGRTTSVEVPTTITNAILAETTGPVHPAE